MNSILRLDKVCFSFGKSEVLESVSFCVNKGDFLSIVGPNGSGKTTLLRVILGILKPSSGVVELSKVRLGYVSQKASNIESNFPASVFEVVSMGSRGSKLDVSESLSKVGMSSFADSRIGELSGGQQQRVLIAKSLVSNPDILFLDEPTSGVDDSSVNSFYSLLKSLNKSGVTVVLVTHDIDRVVKFASKIVGLNRHIVFSGSVKEYLALHKSHKHHRGICHV